jgi:hypothetical protein
MNQEQWSEVVPSGDFWKPEPGNELIGEYVQREENVGPNKSNVYHIKTDEGYIAKVWGCTLLDSRFETMAYGERVKIVFVGNKPAPRRGEGKTFKDFKLFHTNAKHSEDELAGLDEIPVVEDED